MSHSLLVTLLQDLDSRVGRYAALERYYEGHPPLAYLSQEAQIALQNFKILSVNVCRLQVNSIAERLRIIGVSGANVWSEWVRNDLDLLAPVAHRESLLFGSSYACVWADDEGRPRVTIESPKNVTVQRDPVTREVVAAAKRVDTETTTEAWVYLPDRVEHWRAGNPGATVGGFELVDSVDNPLGVVPVVPIVNSDRVDGDLSEIDDLAPLVDALNKLLTDMMIASEFSGRPRRTAVGVELTEVPRVNDDGTPVLDVNGEPVVDTENPFPERNRMMIAENAEAKLGQLDPTDLAGFEAGVKVITSMIMSVSSLPSHYLGVLHSQPTSADSVRSSEASLTARAEAKQLSFAKSWENVCRLIVAVRDSVDVGSVDVQVVWGDAASRSVAQDADAAVKLYQAGILSRTAVLRRLGFNDEQIAEELENVTRDAKMGHDIKFGQFLTELDTRSGKPSERPAAVA